MSNTESQETESVFGVEELLGELLEEARIQNTLIAEQTARLEKQALLLSAKDAQLTALTEEAAWLTA